jgi:hypothetical protein
MLAPADALVFLAILFHPSANPGIMSELLFQAKHS